MGKWEKRFVRIDFEGLRSFKNGNSKPSVVVKETGELWTRFDLMNLFVVVKLKHSGLKMEFGIPVEEAVLWMRGFYSLVKK